MIKSDFKEFKGYVDVNVVPSKAGNPFKAGVNVATVEAHIGAELLSLVKVVDESDLFRVEERRPLKAWEWERIQQRIRELGGRHVGGRPWWIIPNATHSKHAGRPRGSFKPPMLWSIEWVRRRPQVSSRQLARLLNDQGIHVSRNHAKLLRLRARAFLAEFGIVNQKEVNPVGESEEFL